MKSDKKTIITRLNVLKGQINGIVRMIEKDRSYFDLAMQIKSIKASLQNIDNLLLEKEIQSKDENTRDLFKILIKKLGSDAIGKRK